MLEKIIEIDCIEVMLPSGHLQVREIIKIIDDGELISSCQHHRYSLSPGDNLDGYSDAVVSIANAVWTEEVVARHKESHKTGI